ncbi:MAG TPA: hypothetical protein VKE74_14420 [Gemmataceae bacterium]|nr:hypothetical protein [Gemmataceae bacterium]
MRTRTFALAGLSLGLWLAAAVALDEPKVEYKQYASSAGKYKVLFPGPVFTETLEVKTPTGAQSLTLDSVSLPGEILFVVSYIDTPADTAKAPPGQRLDKIRDAARGEDGKVLSEKDLLIGTDKLPARDVVIQKPAVVIRTRIVLAEKRLYQVMIQGKREFVTAATADRFFDSFEVTK